MEQYFHKLINLIDTHFAMTDKSPEGVQRIQTFLQDVFKSFGACEICWGRGYVLKDTPEEMSKLAFCACRRGTELQLLVER